MDPKNSPLNQIQKDRLSTIMNTNTTPVSSSSVTPPPSTSSPVDKSTASTQTATSSSPGKPLETAAIGTAPLATPAVQPSNPLSQTPSPNSLGSTTPPLGEQPLTPSSPLGQPSSTQPTTYQAPTIGMPTTPEVGGLVSQTTTSTAGPELKPSKNKPPKVKSGFPMTILYIVGGIILLIVYTLIWAVVFDLQLPFGITLPF